MNQHMTSFISILSTLSQKDYERIAASIKVDQSLLRLVAPAILDNTGFRWRNEFRLCPLRVIEIASRRYLCGPIVGVRYMSSQLL